MPSREEAKTVIHRLHALSGSAEIVILAAIHGDGPEWANITAPPQVPPNALMPNPPRSLEVWWPGAPSKPMAPSRRAWPSAESC